MRVQLDADELIEVCTYDNRRLFMKVTKLSEGVVCMDLLPRVRYLLRVEPTSRAECSLLPSALFFSYGLLVIPEEHASALVRRAVVFNMSEKAVSISANQELGAVGHPLLLPAASET